MKRQKVIRKKEKGVIISCKRGKGGSVAMLSGVKKNKRHPITEKTLTKKEKMGSGRFKKGLPAWGTEGAKE